MVNNLAWAEAVKAATFRPNARNGGWGGVGGIDSELAPTPGIEAIMPYVVNKNSPSTEVTVTGFNFVNGSKAHVDGAEVPTQVVSRTELKLTVPADALTEHGKHSIVVKNPLPLGTPEWGDTSNPAFLLVPTEFTKTHSNNRF